MEWSYYVKLLGLSAAVVGVRLLLGMGMFRGPDVEYIFDSSRPMMKRLGLLVVLTVVVFLVLLGVLVWYRAEG